MAGNQRSTSHQRVGPARHHTALTCHVRGATWASRQPGSKQLRMRVSNVCHSPISQLPGISGQLRGGVGCDGARRRNTTLHVLRGLMPGQPNHKACFVSHGQPCNAFSCVYFPLLRASFCAWRSCLVPSSWGISCVLAGPGWALNGANLGSMLSEMGCTLNSFSPCAV